MIARSIIHTTIIINTCHTVNKLHFHMGKGEC